MPKIKTPQVTQASPQNERLRLTYGGGLIDLDLKDKIVQYRLDHSISLNAMAAKVGIHRAVLWKAQVGRSLSFASCSTLRRFFDKVSANGGNGRP